MVNYLNLILKKVNATILYIIYGNRLNQLELFLPPIKMKPKDIVVPEGFLLRNFKEQDVDDLLSIFLLSQLNYWNKEKFDKNIKGFVEKGFFVVTDKSTQKVVATMAARVRPSRNQRKSGDIGWLCTDPKYRGKGLGYIVAAASVNCLLSNGYDDIYVNTDDDRLSAIKIFLKLGFKPSMYKKTMLRRWNLIKKKISLNEKY
ncbi:GNAT family N-acetyltransferase [Alphaproteobacteria bacterium]|nr:GNAT family N-acetyltransferase [Alphaproteobacteria bacterium]